MSKKNTKQIKLVWMYPDLMNTYGDRGNVIALQKRMEFRQISVSVIRHGINASISEIEQADMIFMGGAQDRQQEIVARDLVGKKGSLLKNKIDNNMPGLFICGAYQFLGNYYKAADGTKIPGLCIFDLYTTHPGDQKKRLIGNTVVEWNGHTLVGFENHGGRTFLGSGVKPFAKVIKGSGNNAEDNTEGVWYNNAIGSYLHGPILPKNPVLADWIITKALEVKYGKESSLEPFSELYSKKAREDVLSKH